jgi:hypothetical protein
MRKHCLAIPNSPMLLMAFPVSGHNGALAFVGVGVLTRVVASNVSRLPANTHPNQIREARMIRRTPYVCV